MRAVIRRIDKRCSHHDAAFSQYYNDVGRTTIIDAQTEQELFKRYKEHGDLEARDRIIESCLRFVVKLASKYTDDLDKLKDLISAGNMGLLEAIDRFDPDRNTRFLSYATHWVLLHIRQHLHGDALVQMPLWYRKTIRKINRVKTRVMTETGERATDKQLCRAAGVTRAQLEHLRVDRFHYLGVEEMNLSNDGIETRMMSTELREKLETLLPRLPAKECFVIRAYYGFIHDPWSLGQIATFLGVSSERVRQIKEGALGVLKRELKRQGAKHVSDVCP